MIFLPACIREIADKLFAQAIKGPTPSAFLDVGCGTGYLTVKLKGHFPQSKDHRP
jgi:16S rRNA G1207 methylase RsmC